MSSRKGTGILKTVTFRLALWYAVLFSIASTGFSSIISVILTRNLNNHLNTSLMEEIVEVRDIFNTHGLDAFREDITREAESIGTHRSFLRMIDSGGRTLASSDMSYWKGLHTIEKGSPGMNQTVVETLEVPGSYHRARVISFGIEDGLVIQIGNSLHDIDELIENYRRVSAAAFAVMLVIGGFFGWIISRRAMSGVERVTETAAGIGKDDLVSRVPIGGEGKEIDNLAGAFNDMLGRIRGVVTDLKEVTSNIAHDLRSPITRIRGMAETTMSGEQDIASYQEMAGIVVEECDRLVGMINVMLEIAVTEAGASKKSTADVDMAILMKEAREIFHPVAEDKGVSLVIRTASEHLTVSGDLHQLQRMISNLLDNAIKFTHSGGSVIMSLEKDDDRAVITIQDTGIGIPEPDRQRIFDRFYRCDQSRNTPGNGLGLSHVRAIVRAHGGDITVESSPGKGSVFIVVLPVA
jgi:heavy metal sensor kinase